MTQILLYDAARQAIAEARSYDEVRDWEDKAAAIREYARRARNRELEIDAAEIRVRAQRRRGELLAEMKAQGVLAEGRKKKLSTADDSFRLTLSELDTTADESSIAQKLAAIPLDSYERLVARVRARLEKDPKAHSFDVLRERDGPVNGARSVMGSRAEPDDSLDFFPTPPWATRALFKHVLPAIGAEPERFNAAWEPACGEGHIAEVLEEYFETVAVSDVFAYGYHQAKVLDFLKSEERPGVGCDWIITNPPFGDDAEAFVLRALELADVGVAMFFRLQWLETVGRFERIFRPYPPAIIAQFAERVPLHKGRWEPDGATATAYLWIVWHKHEMPLSVQTRFFWIPPGCKDQLTKPDDRERFTVHPVLHLERGEKLDPETGEIHETESQAKADDEATTGPLTEAPGGDEDRPVQTVEAESASRPAGGRTPDATEEHDRDSLERQPDEVSVVEGSAAIPPSGGNCPGENPALVGSNSSNRSKWSDLIIPAFLRRDREAA